MTRNGLARMFARERFKIGAEVGVLKGEYSKVLLELSGVEILYSIDCWTNADGTFATDVYNECVNTLAPFGMRSEIMIERSPEIAAEFKNRSLDFVYIDANHGYDAVLADIRAWYPKIRIGGILAGHDYKNIGKAATEEYAIANKRDRERCGVKAAVQFFCKKKRIRHNVTCDRCRSWWFYVWK